jgi:hypothetical protein
MTHDVPTTVDISVMIFSATPFFDLVLWTRYPLWCCAVCRESGVGAARFRRLQGDEIMGRIVAACMILSVLLAFWPVQEVHAVRTVTVVGNGEGRYSDAAANALTGALDRLTSELDAAGTELTPANVDDLTFRRRILELRILMDLNSLVYDRDQIRGYRDAVDAAYEATGAYQDINVAEKALGTQVSQDVKDELAGRMNGALAPFRDPGFRGELRAFLSRPLAEARTRGGLRTPRLWDLTGEAGTDRYDGIGNAANLASGILRSLQARDLGVFDIFDMDQAIQYHTVRRDLRTVLLISAMFPALAEATVDVVPPLDEFVDDYGETNDAHTSFLYAQGMGIDTGPASAELQREFVHSMDIKNTVAGNHILDQLADRLNQVRDAHRR